MCADAVLDESGHTHLDGSHGRFGIEAGGHAVRVEADDEHPGLQRVHSHDCPISGSAACGGRLGRSLLWWPGRIRRGRLLVPEWPSPVPTPATQKWSGSVGGLVVRQLGRAPVRPSRRRGVRGCRPVQRLAVTEGHDVDVHVGGEQCALDTDSLDPAAGTGPDQSVDTAVPVNTCPRPWRRPPTERRPPQLRGHHPDPAGVRSLSVRHSGVGSRRARPRDGRRWGTDRAGVPPAVVCPAAASLASSVLPVIIALLDALGLESRGRARGDLEQVKIRVAGGRRRAAVRSVRWRGGPGSGEVSPVGPSLPRGVRYRGARATAQLVNVCALPPPRPQWRPTPTRSGGARDTPGPSA